MNIIINDYIYSVFTVFMFAVGYRQMLQFG